LTESDKCFRLIHLSWAITAGMHCQILSGVDWPAAPKSAFEILGMEYDWLECDSSDHFALFSTAGARYAPAAFLTSGRIFRGRVGGPELSLGEGGALRPDYSLLEPID